MKVRLTRAITDVASLAVHPIGTEFDLDTAPDFIKTLFEGGDSRVEAVGSPAKDKVKEETSVDSPTTSSALNDSDPIEFVKGVGPKVAEKLNNAGITTVGELKSLSSKALNKLVGTFTASNIKV
jgi:predicted flap endonuclease-1-like 5' DNA nuclease